MQCQSHQHRQHDTYPLLLDMWKRFPRPDWPHQLPPDKPKQLYQLTDVMVIFDYEGRTTINKQQCLPTA